MMLAGEVMPRNALMVHATTAMPQLASDSLQQEAAGVLVALAGLSMRLSRSGWGYGRHGLSRTPTR